MEKEEIVYNVEDGSKHLIDQKGNSIIQLTKISWNNGPYKMDLRKWAFKGETLVPQKGFSFLTENGPHSLAEILVDIGYGDTEKLQSSLNKRKTKVETKNDTNTYKRNKLLEVIKK